MNRAVKGMVDAARRLLTGGAERRRPVVLVRMADGSVRAVPLS